RWLGAFTEFFDAGSIDPRYAVQSLCIRERVEHPQLLATNRHVTCGAPDLTEVKWEDATLRGESMLVGGDPYELYITEPAGYRLARFEADGAEVLANTVTGGMRTIRLRIERSGHAKWHARYDHTR
ncbi:MAG: hypothetical protein ABIT38_21845, partial [Gemmatimonadaceae bacterium]